MKSVWDSGSQKSFCLEFPKPTPKNPPVAKAVNDVNVTEQYNEKDAKRAGQDNKTRVRETFRDSNGRIHVRYTYK